MLNSMNTPERVVQRQLEAYNARDIEAWLATYDSHAEQYELHGQLLANGHGEMRARMQARFTEPDLHAELLSRTVMGAVVVDHERITRNFSEGRGTIEMLCIYEVSGDCIKKATFAIGARSLQAEAASAA